MLRTLALASLAAAFACGGPSNAPACPVPTGAGVSHGGAVSASETWRAVDGPHTVASSVTINAGATLTVEPCAELLLSPGASVIVNGNLVAEGTATTPISLGAEHPAQPWGFLQVFAPGTVSLAYASVSGGGGESTNAWGMIEARGDQLQPAQEILKLDHVSVTDSADYGISLRAGAAFTRDSGDVRVSGSKRAPLRINPRLASNVPSGSYTGNAEDAIVVATDAYGDVTLEDVVFHDRGVPYRVGDEATLGRFLVGPAHVALTLEAGVVLAFPQAGKLSAVSDSNGTGLLKLAGTAAKPVVLTSASKTPAAGDWVGVELGKIADPGFLLDHVELRYAGGPSQASGFHCQPNPTVAGEVSSNEDAALSIYHQPTSAVLTHSLIADSKGAGVNLAYSGSQVDQQTGNSFSNVASCRVTFPRPASGQCPASVPCP
jgi:hypothetical protein